MAAKEFVEVHTSSTWNGLGPFTLWGYSSLPRRPSQDLSSISIAYQWVGRIFAICIEMILPGIAGYWLDQYFGFGISFLALIGFLLGLVLGMTHLVVMANALSSGKPHTGRSPLPSEEAKGQPPEGGRSGSEPQPHSDDSPRHN